MSEVKTEQKILAMATIITMEMREQNKILPTSLGRWFPIIEKHSLWKKSKPRNQKKADKIKIQIARFCISISSKIYDDEPVPLDFND